MSNDWDSLSRSEKKEEAQKTLRMLKGQKLYQKIIGFIIALTLFGCMFWFYDIRKTGFMEGFMEGLESFKYFPIGCGILFLIAFLKKMYRKFLR